MADKSSVSSIILAAGKGTRMQSPLPKVLHKLAGKSMLAHVVETLKRVGLGHHCLIVGAQYEAFANFLQAHPDLRVCLQEVTNGTGGAVAAAAVCFQGLEAIPYAPSRLLKGQPIKSSHVLICYGDTPAIQADELAAFVDDCLERASPLTVLGMEVPEPFGYGRLLMDADRRLKAIVEEKDASEAERQITSCNSGVILAETAYLFQLLRSLRPENQQKEYYLTDCFALAIKAQRPGRVYLSSNWQNFLGVNNQAQLAALEQLLCGRMAAAVT